MASVGHEVLPRSRQGHGVVLVRRAARARGADLARLEHALAGHDVVECPQHELAGRVRDARKEGRPFVAVADDDPGFRAAVAELAHGETALLPIPARTRDSFATAVGLLTLDDVAAAASHGRRHLIDLGRVNEHCFVNSSTAGVAGDGIAILRGLVRGPRLTTVLDGRPVRVASVVVGNNCFGPRVEELTSRESIEDHLLDVRIALGSSVRAPAIVRRTCPAISIEIPGSNRAAVNLDGEIESLETPLRYTTDPNAITLLVPDGEAN